MAYKDKDRHKQASKEAMQRYRERRRGITPSGITKQGITAQTVTPAVIPKHRYDYHSTNTSNHTLSGSALIKHLEQTSIEQLKAEGYWIPAWKYSGDIFPLEGLKAAMANQRGFNEDRQEGA